MRVKKKKVISTVIIIILAAVIAKFACDLKLDANKNTTVVIDAGHGGYDIGAISVTGALEKDVNLKIALEVGKILEAEEKVRVIYTRKSDDVPWPANKTEELKMRCKIANDAKADMFVSIHCNSNEKSNDSSGIETWCSSSCPSKSKKLADNVQGELGALGVSRNRGLKYGDLYVINNTKSDAILVELGFMSNYEESKMLDSDEYIKKYAQAIAKGILKSRHR